MIQSNKEMFKTRLRLWFLFFSVTCSQLATGQVAASAQLDSTHMLIGDQMALHLMVNHAKGVVMHSPELKVMEQPEVEILHVSDWDTLQKGPEYVLKKDIIFTVWDSGYVFVPQIPVPYHIQSQTGVVSTNQIPLLVEVPAIDTTLAPIKPILREPKKFEDYLPLLAAFLILAAGILAWWYFRKKQKEKTAPPPPEIVLPAHEIALSKLKNLKAKKLWQQGHIKAYQSELTHIVREYLENRYGIQALENTTDEILRALKNTDLPESWENRLREMLQMADLVKFAKAQPEADFHDRMMDYAEAFVLETKQSPAPTEETDTNHA